MYCCPCETPGYLPEPYHIPGYGGHIPTYKQRNGATFGRLSRDIIEDPCVAQAPCPVLQAPGACCVEDPCCRNPVGCEDIGCCEPICCPPPRIVPKRKKPPCEEIICDPCALMKCCDFGMSKCCPPQPCCPPICCPPPKPCCPPPRPSCPPPCPPPCCPSPPPCCPAPPTCCVSPCPPPSCCAPTPACCKPACCDPCAEARAHHLNRGPYACPCKPECDNDIYRCCESMSPSYAGHVPGFTFHSNGRTIGKATWGTGHYMGKCFYFNTFTKP